MESGNKNMFENCHETDSQEAFLQQCRFALQDTPPDSVPLVHEVSPPLNDGVGSHGALDDNNDGDDSRHDPVEIEPIRFVSPPESTETVDSEEEEDEADRTVLVESEVENLEGKKRVGSTVKDDGGKRLKIPVKDVVKAIVINSKKTEQGEEEREVKKMSLVQVLVQKGFKFPGNLQNPPSS